MTPVADFFRLRSEVIDIGNLASVTSVGTLQKSLEELQSDVAQEILDGLVLDLGY